MDGNRSWFKGLISIVQKLFRLAKKSKLVFGPRKKMVKKQGVSIF